MIDQPREDAVVERPFLRAALEDYSIAIYFSGEAHRNSRILNHLSKSARHAVCLMYDALEFLFYEILLENNADIYASGQNTIGFDTALNECKKLGVSLPFIGIIREIQKLRGDAKHHGQVPNQEAFKRVIRAFRLVFSVLFFENFSQNQKDGEFKTILYPYHLALYECHRKARGHKWENAFTLGIRSLIHKRRALYSANDEYETHHLKDLSNLLSEFECTKDLSATPEEANSIDSLCSELKSLITQGRTRAAAEKVGSAFASLDFIAPTIFDIKKSRKITTRLYQTSGHILTGMWSMDHDEALATLCRKNPELIKSFGQSHYASDEDKYWTWWNFALFDGIRWQPFHLDERFRISSEPTGNVRSGTRPSNFARLVCAELELALELPSSPNSSLTVAPTGHDH